VGGAVNKELARKLRRQFSYPEQAMWRVLYPLRQQGSHFRRQVEIGTYFVDFACHRPAVVIEVDGLTHATEIAASNDATRDDYLAGRGYRVLRFWNNEVNENPEGVYQVIESCVKERLERLARPTLDPSPRGGGRRLRGSAQ
jgi:very-short-patch-repair endonuclease